MRENMVMRKRENMVLRKREKIKTMIIILILIPTLISDIHKDKGIHQVVYFHNRHQLAL